MNFVTLNSKANVINNKIGKILFIVTFIKLGITNLALFSKFFGIVEGSAPLVAVKKHHDSGQKA